MKNVIQYYIKQLQHRMATEGMIEEKIEGYLQAKHEGDVFVHVYSEVNGRTLMTSKRYYVVKNGVVHEIFDGKVGSKTGDSVFCLTYQCIKIGKYNPKFKYMQKSVSIPYAEFCKKNKL